jgi:hypothetical protein
MRFARAIERGTLRLAELAALEMKGRLTLDEALALVCLYARERSPRYERAALRFLARFADEPPGVRLSQVQLVAALLAELSHTPYATDKSRLIRQVLDTAARQSHGHSRH